MKHSFKKAIFLCFLALQTTLFAKEIQKEIHKAEIGDFVVYAYKQQVTLLRIAENNESELAVEEISIQDPQVKNWQQWLSSGAPNHSSWTISCIDIKKGTINSIFNVDEGAYTSTPAAFQFLPSLLTSSLEPITASERKYVGPQPMAGEMDFRPLWFPKIIFEGKELKPKIEAFRFLWPDDDSELSGRHLDIYIPENEAISYLPYWIELNAGLNKVKISVIDSGKKLTSPVSAPCKS